ncbi:MAG: DNA adenine methylase [Armatimonadota bacterium]|nr:DNA adenine methylase [Armatimonadota bacterium]
MELFATDLDRLAFLLETDAVCHLEDLIAQAAELVTEELPEDKRPKYITNYIGSKQKLVDWIWKHTPEGISSVLDAFSGSAVVAYMYKTKGLKVIANDRLRYCYHAARAIIENGSVRITQEELDALLADNPRAGTFVRDNFKGLFFADGVHKVIDNIRANIDTLSGYKKDIALFALGKACLGGKGGFGHFSSSTDYGKRQDTPDEFRERFSNNVARINALVFDNGQQCKAYRKDINEMLSDAKVDLAYFDPPYATEFSTTNYEKAYHFVEGLMTYWEGLTLVGDSKTHHYKTDHKTVTKANAREFFSAFLSSAKHIPNWLISYRDHAYPNEDEMKEIISASGMSSRMQSQRHHYHISSRHSENSQAVERLFVCSRASEMKQAAALCPVCSRIETQAEWDETENEIRYRVRDPEEFESDSLRRKPLDGVDGVSIVIGRLKDKFVPDGDDPRSMVLQAYRFAKKTEENPDGWTLEKAQEWIEEHEPESSEAEIRVEKNMQALADAPLSDEMELLSCQAGMDPVRVTGFMGNKFMMLGWIERQVPKDAKTLLDAFSGGANVAYHFKRKGMKVITNDLLLYPYHIARAVVENSHETLSDDDIEAILAPNTHAGTFIVDNFHGYYYTKKVLAWLDQVWANIQKLPGYKKDLALAALGNTVKAKSLYGQFHRSKLNLKADADVETEAGVKENQLVNLPVSSMVESFKRYASQLNKLVFDNGRECRAFHGDAVEAVRKFGADVLYLDPPYITEFSNNDYEYSLHFVEGLMNRWADKTLLNDNRRSYQSRTHYDRDSIRSLIESLATEARGKYGTVILSYRDRAFPTEKEIRDIFSERLGNVRVRGMDVEYNIVLGKEGEGKTGRELLFISSKSGSAPKSSAAALPANCHTSIPVEVRITGSEQLSADATDITPNSGDPQFGFIMCRVGTNKNGDHFTPEELSTRCTTAINKKIDLKHSQDLTDIVGGIIASEFVEDETGGRVECVGELYVADTPTAALAYKLMKKGIISQVSMECDYEAGECSICGKMVTNKNDYCIHLRKYKGAEYQGKPVFEILHGVTFTGLGLLDRKGADENARITQVASQEATHTTSGGSPVEDDKKTTEERHEDAAKKSSPAGGGGAPANDEARVKELEAENKDLKNQVLDLQKRIAELEAESKAAANKSRAAKLVQKLEKAGMTFASDEDREKELTRLAELSDDAFAATEAAYDRAIQAKPECSKTDTRDGDDAKPKPESQADRQLRTDAGVRPLDVDDKKTSLEDKLRDGFMIAYRDRVGTASPDKSY